MAQNIPGVNSGKGNRVPSGTPTSRVVSPEFVTGKDIRPALSQHTPENLIGNSRGLKVKVTGYVESILKRVLNFQPLMKLNRSIASSVFRQALELVWYRRRDGFRRNENPDEQSLDAGETQPEATSSNRHEVNRNNQGFPAANSLLPQDTGLPTLHVPRPVIGSGHQSPLSTLKDIRNQNQAPASPVQGNIRGAIPVQRAQQPTLSRVFALTPLASKTAVSRVVPLASESAKNNIPRFNIVNRASKEAPSTENSREFIRVNDEMTLTGASLGNVDVPYYDIYNPKADGVHKGLNVKASSSTAPIKAIPEADHPLHSHNETVSHKNALVETPKPGRASGHRIDRESTGTENRVFSTRVDLAQSVRNKIRAILPLTQHDADVHHRSPSENATLDSSGFIPDTGIIPAAYNYSKISASGKSQITHPESPPIIRKSPSEKSNRGVFLTHSAISQAPGQNTVFSSPA
jgi:hypothetical protein